jgi:hypothetical protein
MADARTNIAGFTVRLEGASLFDLIQFECMDHVQKALRVTAGARSGTLYFRGGNLVHATAGELVGEYALATMLTWQNGQIAHIEGAWPITESISGSWQSVLLHAATAQDEVSRVDNVVTFPSRESSSKEAPGIAKEAPGIAKEPPSSAKVEALVQPAEESNGGIHAVRITASGDVRAAAADRDAAETFAYVAELADRVGDALAIDGMLSIEIWSSDANGVLVRDPKTSELRAAWASRDVDPARLRERLGQMPMGEI